MKLRKFEESDVSRLVSLADDLEVSRYMTTAFPYPYTTEDAVWWVQEGSKQGMVRAIESEGLLVGCVGAQPLPFEHSRTANIGYWLGREYWGRGLAARALSLLTEQIFQETEIVRLQASVYSPNIASMRVLEKAGYRQEAILAQAIFKHNQFYDEYIFSKLSRTIMSG